MSEEFQHRLRWIQINRAGDERAAPVGDVARFILGELADKNAGRRQRIAVLLDRVVDGDFRSVCEVVRCANGLVTIEVSEASLVSVMRVTWEGVLERVLGAQRVPGGPWRVEFRCRKGHRAVRENHP